ncbi:zinc finger CCHC domain-containing protein 7 isoform X2 [Amia ocellicauda]|uniref:zinc finger CCHC domain-containing protein 7 isoform X2 n=1 Tax=Amia ocellicauda TaxID=2972642 RepID=UPI003463D349
MFAGYEAVEEYEDELYKEPEASSESEPDSEVEFHLYSQVHYAAKMGDESKEDEVLTSVQAQQDEVITVPSDSEVEVITVSDDTEGDGVCAVKGRKTEARRKVGSLANPTPSELPEFVEFVESSDDSDYVESWMILGQEKQDEDNTILLNLEVHSNSSQSEAEDNTIQLNVDVDLTTLSDDSVRLNRDVRSDRSHSEAGDRGHSWTISDKDIEAQIGKSGRTPKRPNRYYASDKNVNCRNCKKNGHLSKNCPTPKKVSVCCLCAMPGHIQYSCPHRHCPNCGLPGHCYEECTDRAFWNKQCRRCSMTGHYADACPEIWRQYHLTTTPGPLVQPEGNVRPKIPAYCYNCSRKGHFGYECTQRRMFNKTFPALPFVTYYDTEQDMRSRNHRLQRKAQELREAGLMPQMGTLGTSHVERKREEPTRKRIKKNKGWEEVEQWGAQTSKPNQQQRPQQKMKTWPEKRKERRLQKQQRKKIQEGEDTNFPRGPKKPPAGGHSHPKKGRPSPGLFGPAKQLTEETHKRKRRAKRKSTAGQDRHHEDSYPADENLFLIKQRSRRRKR